MANSTHEPCITAPPRGISRIRSDFSGSQLRTVPIWLRIRRAGALQSRRRQRGTKNKSAAIAAHSRHGSRRPRAPQIDGARSARPGLGAGSALTPARTAGRRHSILNPDRRRSPRPQPPAPPAQRSGRAAFAVATTRPRCGGDSSSPAASGIPMTSVAAARPQALGRHGGPGRQAGHAHRRPGRGTRRSPSAPNRQTVSAPRPPASATVRRSARASSGRRVGRPRRSARPPSRSSPPADSADAC